MLFVAPNTVARWERGELEVSGWTVLAMMGLSVARHYQEKKAGASPGQTGQQNRRSGNRRRSRRRPERGPAEALREADAMVPITGPRLRQLLQLCHPDKHANSATATDVTAWLNQIRRRP